VYQSAYGSVRGVPMALAGLLWFTLIALLVAFDAGRGSDTPAYIFLLSTAALAVVLYMAYASFFVLQKLCPACLVMYLAVAGLFGVSGAAAQSNLGAVPRRFGRDLKRMLRNPIAATVAALYVIGAASALAFFPRSEVSGTSSEQAPAAAQEAAIPAEQIAELEQWLKSQPRAKIDVAADGAAVVIVKFNDYQCPPCRQSFVEYKPVIDRYQAQQPGKVKLVSIDFPLEAECNTGGVHVAGCEAAAAVRMARARNRADAMEQWLFERQPSMSPDLVREGVKDVAGVTDFDAQYPKVLEQVKRDVAMGRQLGVNRTPTFFINGVKFEGVMNPRFFDAAIALELKRSPASQP
jgi:protein-disulfide isomerase